MFYHLAIYFKLHVFRITLLVQCRGLDYFFKFRNLQILVIIRRIRDYLFTQWQQLFHQLLSFRDEQER